MERVALTVRIEDLLDGVVESARLEFKRSFTAENRDAVLQTASAFANDLHNLDGGYIVVGVEAPDGRASPASPGVPSEDLDRVQQAIANAFHQIKPEYAPLITVAEHEGKSFVIIRCPAGESKPYRAPGRAGRPDLHVRIGAVTQVAKGDLERQLTESAARVPFDERRHATATVDDLSIARVQEHLRSIQSPHASADRDAPWLYERLGLLVGVNGHKAPKNGAILCFGANVQALFPSAVIEVTVFPEGKAGSIIDSRRFGGTLPEQLKGVAEFLRSRIRERLVKVTGEAAAQRVQEWPFDAVEEALSNAVYHRGYESDYRAVQVEIQPSSLDITSFPGPLPGLSAAELRDGEPPPQPARNRRIGDILKEARLVEAHGTGIPRIRSAMRMNGSPAPVFEFDDARTWFRVRLPTHPAFDLEHRGQPVRLGQPIPANEVVGRTAEVERFWSLLRSGDVAVYGPPGRGVTTFLAACERAAPSDHRWVPLDLRLLTVRGAVAAVETALHRDEEGGDSLLPALVSWDAGAYGVAVLVVSGWDERTLPELDDERIHRLSRVRVVRVRPPIEGPVPGSVFVLPPLDRPAAVELATRYLRYAHGREPDAAIVDEVVNLTGGNPGLIGPVCLRLSTRASPIAAVRDALDDLWASPGDPYGLRARRDATLRPTGPGAALLHLAGKSGRARHEIVGGAVSGGWSRVDVVTALGELVRTGLLAEVDGVVRPDLPDLVP